MGVRLDEQFDDGLGEVSEINVTPFVDVMLVLLIIFIVAAPLATVDVLVDLPSASAQPQPRPDEPIFITLTADLTLLLGDTAVHAEQLPAQIDALTEGDKETRLFVRADQTVPYGQLMDLMNDLRRAGYLHIGLVALEAMTDAR
jgi:biopolymer transport protein ExbD